ALRNVEIFSFVGKSAVRALPDRGNDIERLFPTRAGFFVGDAETAQLDLGCRAPGANLDPAVTQDIQRCNTLGNPYRMIVGKRAQHHGMPNTNDAGALGDRAVEHFRRRRMGKAGLKMMLHGPEMAEASLFRQVNLLEHLMENLILALAML